MAVNAGPKLETNGLIYSIDPGNSRSYSIGGNATSLVSLIPGLTGNGNLRVGASVARIYGGCIALDGVNDYVTLPMMANWDRGNSYGYDTITFEFWIYPQDTDGTSFLSRYYDSNFGIKSITLTDSTSFSFRGKTSYSGNISSNWTFTTNKWTHIVMAISPTQVTIYKDGTQSFTASHGITMGYDGTLDSMNNEGVVIGTGVPYNYAPVVAPTSSMQGYVGIINIYNKILSAQDVFINYQNMRSRYNV